MEQWKEYLLKSIDSSDYENDWNHLLTLQKEQAPWLSYEQLEECVVFSFVKLQGNHKLDWLYWEYKKSLSNHSEDSVAA